MCVICSEMQIFKGAQPGTVIACQCTESASTINLLGFLYSGINPGIKLLNVIKFVIFDYFLLLYCIQDVSCNELQSLPAELGQLETLRDLNLRRNQLTTLPQGTPTHAYTQIPNNGHFEFRLNIPVAVEGDKSLLIHLHPVYSLGFLS